MNRRARTILAVLAAGGLVIGGWWFLMQPGQNPEPVGREAGEAVLKAMMREQWDGGGDGKLCVEVNRIDLSQAARSRLADARLLPGSACHMSQDGAVRVIGSGEKATALHIGPQVCNLLANRCDVEASAVYGNLGANGMIYTVEKQAGHWQVTGQQATWIS